MIDSDIFSALPHIARSCVISVEQLFEDMIPVRQCLLNAIHEFITGLIAQQLMETTGEPLEDEDDIDYILSMLEIPIMIPFSDDEVCMLCQQLYEVFPNEEADFRIAKAIQNSLFIEEE